MCSSCSSLRHSGEACCTSLTLPTPQVISTTLSYFVTPIHCQSCAHACARVVGLEQHLSRRAAHAGHPARLAFGVDSEGNVCGQKNGATGPDFTSRKFLYYLNPLALLQTSALEGAKAICVSQCPGANSYCGTTDLPCHNGTTFMCGTLTPPAKTCTSMQ